MLVWSVFAVLTAIAAVSVLLPYARARRDAVDLGGSDAEVYKDQLGEIDKDLERGALSAAEADAARLEISRRLLKASDLPSEMAPQESAKPRWRPRFVLATAFLIVPLAAIAIYLSYGAPSLPDRPLSDRLATSIENQDVSILVARVEGALQDNPDDARGWAILAPIYVRQGRFFEARRAFEQLLRIEGDVPAILTDLGELIVIENQGLVTDEAMQRFTTALDADPSFPKARYYRALGLVQDGELDEARAILVALRNDGGPGAPWTQGVDALLADMQSAVRLPAPDQASVEAITALRQDDQRAAIEGMVAGLAARLETAPDDLAGWSQLIRAYAVLERPEEARRSLLIALDHFASDDPARLRLLTIAEELQIDAMPQR